MAEYKSELHKAEDLASFKSAADELLSCKFILAEKRISELLKTIAANKELVELFKTALSGYNYAVEFNKSRVASKGKVRLELPKNQARKIAYVFCLLMEFDIFGGLVAVKVLPRHQKQTESHTSTTHS